jgi:hypothetical protein
MNKSAKSRYARLQGRREQFLKRGRDYAAITVPSILPAAGFSSAQSLPEPYQAFGARLVMTLSSRLLTALLPAGIPFFKLSVPPQTLIKSGELSANPDIEKGLALSELLMDGEVQRRSWRQPTSVSCQQLIVTGNSLEYMQPDNTIKVFRLDQYVVARDVAGNWVEIVVEEKVSPLALPEEARALVPDKDRDDPECSVDLYTRVRRLPDGSYASYQEVNEVEVPRSRGLYKAGVPCPWMPLRWSIVAGEDYGRGKCEEHGGDLRSLESLSKAMLDGAAMAARNITMVKPNATGTNLKTKLAKANNGDVVVGDFEAIHMLQFTNVQGLQIVQQELATLRESLGAAFILHSAVQRDAERVTAYETRMIAEELEGTLGGTYSLLSGEMQQPRVERLVVQMQAQQKLPPWGKDMVEPKITTGLEALNREKDVNRVTAAANIAHQLDPNQEYAKTGDLLKIAFNGLGLPAAVRTEEEAQQVRVQRAQAQSMAQAAGDIATHAATAATPGGQ